MIHPILEFFGLGAGAVAVYLASLKLKEGSTSDIAHAAHLPRSTAKRYIEQLLEKGFVGSFLKKKRKVIVAKPPEYVKRIMGERLADFSAAMPRLEQLAGDASATPRIRFYEGATELHTLYDDMLEEQRPIDAITSPDDTTRVLGDYFKRFVERRIEKKIPMRLLAPNMPQSRQFQHEDSGSFRTTQFLAPGSPFHTATYIYGNKTAIVSLRDPKPSGILIEDALVANAQRILFELLWGKSFSP